MACWMRQNDEVCFVHLGKFGDIMIMLPAFKVVADELGKPVICMVSEEFASIFDGVSYVHPWAVRLGWWSGVSKARDMARSEGFDPIVVKWWDIPGEQPPINGNNKEMVELKIHGKVRRIQASEWDSFQSSQWRYAGFTMKQMMDWPLVFDRRSPDREYALRKSAFKTGRKKLLVNLSQSGTSPFRMGPQVKSMLYSANMEIVDIQGIRAHRIYDLLGLYDHAGGLVTSDTSTLHLAAASKIPYIAFINDGGAGSIPKGNCILSIRYSQFRQNTGRFITALRSLYHA